MIRQEVLDYCREQYGTEPEYPWQDTPLAAVLRHRDNAKWYGLIMDVSGEKLGRGSREPVDVLNIKGDPEEIVHIREMPGFAPAYHMNKKHWLTVILEEIADPKVVFRMLDKSYDMTAPKRRKTMETRNKEQEGITLLGNRHTQYPTDYDPSVLETFDNKHPGRDYFVKFNCPEFTSLCPITGQPDFAAIYISYVPDIKMVESKSLKLYLFSFRNHGDFHEDCVNIIMNDLIKLMQPKYIEVWGKFLPRGGISIDPYCNYGAPGTKWEQVAWDRLTHHDLYPEAVNNR